MADYSKMNTEDFDRILLKVMKEQSAEQLLGIAGIYEVVSEEFNNEVLDRWAAEQPEPEDEDDEEDNA